jgi:small subunit ribosomal protein S16
VIADQRKPRDGRSIEEIGTYDPLADPPVIEVDAERALAWLQNGAQPSDTARSLLRARGIMAQFDAIKKGKPLPELTPAAEVPAEDAAEEEAPAEETPEEETPPEAAEQDQEPEAEAEESEAEQ